MPITPSHLHNQLIRPIPILPFRERPFVMKPLLAAGLAATLLLGACSGAEAPPAPQPIPVRTVTIASQSVPNVIELPGRVEPVRVAEVRARVTGIVQQRLYEEGTDVRAGQPLFRIDPRELRASYAQTQAALQRAQATAANARAVVERYRPLVEENAISGQEYDAALAASREAQANVAQIRAQLEASSLQLGYTTVRAPIAGRVGRAQVTEGALVSNGQAQELATIQHNRLPVKVFVLNNGGYLTIKQTQELGFEKRYMGIDGDSGLSFPDFMKLAEAHGIKGVRLTSHQNLKQQLEEIMEHDGPVFCEIMMDTDQMQAPKAINRRNKDGTMRQTPLEDSYPFLDPAEIQENMDIANKL